jgi:hypothetical protein
MMGIGTNLQDKPSLRIRRHHNSDHGTLILPVTRLAGHMANLDHAWASPV